MRTLIEFVGGFFFVAALQEGQNGNSARGEVFESEHGLRWRRAEYVGLLKRWAYTPKWLAEFPGHDSEHSSIKSQTLDESPFQRS